MAEWAALQTIVGGNPERMATWSHAATDSSSPAHETHHCLPLLRTPVRRHGRYEGYVKDGIRRGGSSFGDQSFVDQVASKPLGCV